MVERSGVEPSRAAERNQPRVSGIGALLDRDGADRSGHHLFNDAEDPEGCVVGCHAQSVPECRQGRFGLRSIDGEPPAE